MSDFADALEGYLVPIKEAINTSGKLYGLTAATALASLGLIGWSKSYEKKKAESDRLETNKRNMENRAAFLNSPENKPAIDYVNRKYGINCTSLDADSSKVFYKKLVNSVEKDIAKIARKLNSDKNLCNEMYNRAKNDDLIDQSDLKEISSGICPTTPEDYSDDFKDIIFTVIDASQNVINVIGDYYYDAFSTALNTKYSKEIQLRFISKFSMQGDGDEGLVGCRFYGRE